MAWYKRYIVIVLWVLTHLGMWAQDNILPEQPQQDSVVVSVLTCTPGTDLYAKFGHTALRVRNWTHGEDVVFNYGCFNYNADNFIWKFLLGQTDYLLEAEDFELFMYRYGRMGNGVTEQVLNLSQQEASRLQQLLLENLQPENQEYRYNWLYDNCTERARDMVEKAVEGKIVYQTVENDVTVRDLLNACLQTSPWASFGINMILGAEIDRKADGRTLMFLPDMLRNEANRAIIVKKDGKTERESRSIPYIVNEEVILEETNAAEAPMWMVSPICVFAIMLLVAIGLSVREVQKRCYAVWFDVLLHLVQGLAGVLVAFLFFFSEHAGCDSNSLVVLFNPLWLVYAGVLLCCYKKKKANVLAVVNMVVLDIFFVWMIIGTQEFHPAMWLVIACLMVRAAMQVWHTSHLRIVEQLKD